jgi:hypothetical protein
MGDVRSRGRTVVTILTFRDVGTFRNRYDYRVLTAFRFVIAGEPGSQFACFRPNGGVGLRIVIFGLLENFDCDYVFLDALALAVERRLHHESKEPAHPRRVYKDRTGEDFAELCPDSGTVCDGHSPFISEMLAELYNLPKRLSDF